MHSVRSFWFRRYFPQLADDPYPSELLNATAPQMLLALVDSGYFFYKYTDLPCTDIVHPVDPLNVYLSWYEERDMWRDMRRWTTRAVADRLESLAGLLGEKTEETTPFEVCLWEEAAYLKDTYEYQATGIAGEKCNEDCNDTCWRCGGGDPNYRGEERW